jgi:predicted ATP-grasp superfamily ATP-dependent carboligase
MIEVNPRYTASVEVVERMTGISALDAHVAACLMKPRTPEIRREVEGRHGKIILYAKHDAVITSHFHNWAMEQASSGRQLMLADIPAEGEHIASGRPVLSALASTPPASYDHVMNGFIAEIESRLYSP